MNIKKMTNTIKETKFNLPGQTKFYKGKVRDVYTVNNETLVMVASDRISAFDHVLPEGIPYKGQVLSQIAAKFRHQILYQIGRKPHLIQVLQLVKCVFHLK